MQAPSSNFVAMKTLPRKTSAHNETVAPLVSAEMTALSTTTVNKRFRLLVPYAKAKQLAESTNF